MKDEYYDEGEDEMQKKKAVPYDEKFKELAAAPFKPIEGVDTDYKLIPMDEITPEARLLAVRWVEGYEPRGFDLPGKHKLASDIMNYARRYHEQEMKKEK